MTQMERAKRRAVGQPCPYCRRLMGPKRNDIMRRRPSVDHVDPRHPAGRNASGNRIVCCMRCNEDKAALTLEQWHADLTACNDLRASVVAAFIASRAQPADEVAAAANGWLGAAEATQ